eukprot:GHVU01113839.1.p1 GENE.GHVU01113839.1~~GHVU01113839.1.p1  ORF type:complete len:492 (+),score=70.44 GHVU01113839.1:61-1536(+)
MRMLNLFGAAVGMALGVILTVFLLDKLADRYHDDATKIHNSITGNFRNDTPHVEYIPIPAAATTYQCSQYSIDIEAIYWTRPEEDVSYGTVVFLGKMSADSWRSAAILHIPRVEGFDVLAISPPGFGNSSNITSLFSEQGMASPVSQFNYLEVLLQDCFKVPPETAVIVVHSNWLARHYVFPLLTSRIVLAYVLWNTRMGTDWLVEVDPVQNDHYFYRPLSINYYYVGERRRLSVAPAGGSDVGADVLFNVDGDADSAPTLGGGVEGSGSGDNGSTSDMEKKRVKRAPTSRLKKRESWDLQRARFRADSRKTAPERTTRTKNTTRQCRADPTVAGKNESDYNVSDNILGPLWFFAGKNKKPGWFDELKARLKKNHDDYGDYDKYSQTYPFTSEYFMDLRYKLWEFLPDVRKLLLDRLITKDNWISEDHVRGSLSKQTKSFYKFVEDNEELYDEISDGAPCLRDERKEQYLKVKTQYQQVEPETIMCLPEVE